MSRRLLVPAATVLAAMLVAPPAAAQIVYLAFGDSITAGSFDTTAEPGYPPELEDLLRDRGVDAVVENHGWPGEDTIDGLARIGDVLDGGGDVLLLMEGTNDINNDISRETTLFNLDAMADRAEDRGLEVVHATIIPRLPAANRDQTNLLASQLSGAIRELAWRERRNLADPFYVFFHQIEDAFVRYYVGGGDNLHLNADGYDRLALVFADAITGTDEVPPVTGLLTPYDDEQAVPRNRQIQIDLYDFGAGIDTGFTQLFIDGEPVEADVQGDARRQTIRFSPPDPWSGVVFVGLEARDIAVPPNERDSQLVQFVTEGTSFLRGDITRDGRVDGHDLIDLARPFGTVRGEARYRGYADFNDDGAIDGQDLAILASNFGKSS
jgi:lysophospholipase L1-like esterase